MSKSGETWRYLAMTEVGEASDFGVCLAPRPHGYYFRALGR